MKMSDTEQVHFKKPFTALLTVQGEDHFVVSSHELGISAQAETLTKASQFFKAKFVELAVDLHSKSKYAPLSGKERERHEKILETCDIHG